MFYIFDDVPEAPYFDLQSMNLRNPASQPALKEMLDKRTELVKTIKGIASDQTVKEFNAKRVDECLQSSIELVI